MRCASVLANSLAILAWSGAVLAQTPIPQAPSLFRFALPPAGFDAVNAPDADLARYGLPPRPVFAARNSRAMRIWVRVMSAARNPVSPEVRLTGRLHGPAMGLVRAMPGQQDTATGLRHSAMYSHNWSGQALSAPNASFGSSSFAEIMGQWVISAVQQPVGSCSGTDVSATWVGMDGMTSSDVLQAGTESDASCANGVTTQDIYPWFEWYPNYAYQISNFPTFAGSSVFVVVRANSATSGTAIFVNLQNNQYTVIGITPPAGTSLKGDSSEWIVERPSLGAGKTLGTLADFGMVGMMSELTYLESGVGGQSYVPGYPGAGQTGAIVTMVDSNNGTIAMSSPQGTFAQFVFAEGSTL